MAAAGCIISVNNMCAFAEGTATGPGGSPASGHRFPSGGQTGKLLAGGR